MPRLRMLAGMLLVAAGLAACSGASRTTSSTSPPSPAGPERTIVARYAGETLTLSALDSAYAASVGGPENAADSSLAAYRTFLDQYVNFRLKVRAAHDAGLDTLASVTRDVANYRQQMARPRLLREKVYEPVVRTLYERRNTEVDVSHIMTRPASKQDTAEAYRTLQQIVDSLERGVPFDELARRNSDDPAARQEGRRGYRGRLGYVQAGQVVEPFENRMYALEPGTVSDIFRTQYGFHVIKVHGRRPAQQPVHLSHILLRGDGDSTETRRFLDSLRTEIVQGNATFASVAKEHSEDRRSARKGGDLGTAKPQGLPDAFREAIAQMDTVGAVSPVLRTRFGYHLVKFDGRDEKKSFAEAYPELKEQVSGRGRVERKKQAFAHQVRTDEGVSVDTTRILRTRMIPSVDSLARPLLSLPETTTNQSQVVATLGDSSYTLGQVSRHLVQSEEGAQMTVAELVESFLNEKALKYAGARLEERDPEFATEMKKYREGVLLFRFMQDSVWTAAAQDTAGLRATFEANRDEYRFPERVRTIVLRASTDSLLQPYAQMHGGSSSPHPTIDAAVDDSLISVDTVLVTDESAEVYQRIRSVADGGTVGPTARRNEWLFMIRDTKLAPRRKTFEEARSNVIQDYQQAYEDHVLRKLRRRYDAQTYPQRLRPPFGGSPDSSASNPTGK